MYGDGKMRPIEIIPGMIKENDGRGEVSYHIL
jgi:hypothetical protein